MKLLGTVAHSRCTVVRPSSRMVPEPQLQTQSLSQAAAMASRALGRAQLKDRFTLWHREELPDHATLLLLLLLQNTLAFRAKTLLSVWCARTQSLRKREEGAAWEREGSGPSMLWQPSSFPSSKTLDSVCPSRGDVISVPAHRPGHFGALKLQNTQHVEFNFKEHTNIYTPEAQHRQILHCAKPS